MTTHKLTYIKPATKSYQVNNSQWTRLNSIRHCSYKISSQTHIDISNYQTFIAVFVSQCFIIN